MKAVAANIRTRSFCDVHCQPIMPVGEHAKTALVLAGGGSFGAVQVGMLKALVASGVQPDFVVGSSVGAMNAAYYAGGPTIENMAKLDALWRGLTRNDIFPVDWRTLAGFARRRDFLVSSRGIRDLVDRHLPYRNLQDAALPIHIIATDVLSGNAVVLSSGSVADAILASTAIPVAFAPVLIGQQYLIDGAVTSNTPVRVAVALGARRLIVLPTGFACNLDCPPKGAIASALHALTLLIARQLVGELETLSADIEYAIVPTLCPLAGSPYDFANTGAMIDLAEALTTSWIASGGLSSRVIPNALRAHNHPHH
jgi:NTE family protein